MNAFYAAQRAEMDYRISRISTDVLSARRARRLQRRQEKHAAAAPAHVLSRADLTRRA